MADDIINFTSSDSTSMTTSTSVHGNTTLLDTSKTSVIAGSVVSVILVILLAILGVFLWRKKRPLGMTYINNVLLISFFMPLNK